MGVLRLRFIHLYSTRKLVISLIFNVKERLCARRCSPDCQLGPWEAWGPCTCNRRAQARNVRGISKPEACAECADADSTRFRKLNDTICKLKTQKMTITAQVVNKRNQKIFVLFVKDMSTLTLQNNKEDRIYILKDHEIKFMRF